MKRSRTAKPTDVHDAVVTEIVELIEVARRRAARAVNATMTAVYWSIGRRIVLEEQHGARRAEYGEELIERLAHRLTTRFGRGSIAAALSISLLPGSGGLPAMAAGIERGRAMVK